MRNENLLKEAKELIQYICEKEGYKSIPKVKIAYTDCSYAHFRTNSITLSLWNYERFGIEGWYAIIIHEIVHLLIWDRLHNDRFKECERKWLREFGLIPIYQRAYARKYEYLNGRTAFLIV